MREEESHDQTNRNLPFKLMTSSLVCQIVRSLLSSVHEYTRSEFCIANEFQKNAYRVKREDVKECKCRLTSDRKFLSPSNTANI